MTVYYPCPACGANVDDDNEWIQKYPIKYCTSHMPYHDKCGPVKHSDFCNCGLDEEEYRDDSKGNE